MHDADVAVVGSGPNGLAAGITMARAGFSVQVLEAAATAGGGMRSAELTLPGFHHDVCSAIHPLAVASPFLRTLPLETQGLEWVHPPVPVAHPLESAQAVALHRSLERTVSELGDDGPPYERLLSPLVSAWESLMGRFLRPLRPIVHTEAGLRFAAAALRSAEGLAQRFTTDGARALLAGLCGHSVMPLDRAPSAAVGVVLSLLGHAVGWPFPRGGSQRLADAMLGVLRSLGGRIETSREVRSLEELGPRHAIFLDLSPAQILRLAGDRLPPGYRRQLRAFRYGPGVCKLDLALDGPIPWRDEVCRRTACVHVGGSFAEIAEGEAQVWRGGHPERPFVLLAQPSLFDPTRAPTGRHTAWAYCHVPNGSTVDVSPRMEAQIERFAPGFRDRILARHVTLPAQLERYNANYVGGDINGGAQTLWQIVARPALRLDPYRTPLRGLWICSSSTPPGGGVHGMCGHLAARSALASLGVRQRGGGVRPARRAAVRRRAAVGAARSGGA